MIRIALPIFLTALLPAAALAASPSPQMLAQACTGCHGPRGVSAGASIPALAAQPAECLVRALRAFRSGERASALMGRIAKGYGDAEIVAMAEHFSQQAGSASADQGCADK